jgi:membrane protein DedA with SNARE-associated domain
MGAYMPIEVVLFFTLLFEELAPIIPTGFIVISAGSIAFAKGYSLAQLVLVALLGAVAKTFGSIVIYALTDRLEDLIMVKWGRYLGVSHKQVEGIGKRLSGSWKDGFVLFLLRVFPGIPSTLISATCGFIKIDRRLFMYATFAGSFVKTSLLLYLGYIGITNMNRIIELLIAHEEVAAAISIVFILFVVALIVMFVFRWKSLRTLFSRS